MFIRHRQDLVLEVGFRHALGLKALLRHGKSPFHYLELLSTQAATFAIPHAATCYLLSSS